MKTFYFTPDYNTFNFEDPKTFKNLPKELRQRRHVMTIKEYKENRSKQQNAYYWGVVLDIISKETGYFPDEVHQEMGREFLAYEKKGKWFVKSTTELGTKEMEDYLQRVRMFASTELHCLVPLPNETEFKYEVK